MGVRRQNVGQFKFIHQGHARQIREGNFRFVGEPLAEFESVAEARFCDCFDADPRRLNKSVSEAPGFIKWPAIEKQRKRLV